jgi:superoxide dismutase, Fe-Mn family
MAYQVPPLPYDYSALEPTIDAQTMQLHHDKHHAAYVTNANGALEKHPELEKKFPLVEELLRNINQVPEDVRTALRNNAGGHSNHTMFWAIMQAKGGGPARGQVSEAISNLWQLR